MSQDVIPVIVGAVSYFVFYAIGYWHGRVIQRRRDIKRSRV